MPSLTEGTPVPDWFRRFGDIPGVSFQPPSDLHRRRLPGHEASPELEVFEYEGTLHETLSWPTDHGGGSASPVQDLTFGGVYQKPTPILLRRVYEGLELPGKPSDYHFLILGCVMALWDRRRDEPEVLAEVERLCWLDVQLVQARPDAVTNEYAEEGMFYSLPTFARLIDLYQREGALREALEVAELGVPYGQSEAVRERLLERIGAVEAEVNAEQP